MHEELASVRGTVDLHPSQVLERAEAFLLEQGYAVAHRTGTTLTVERQVTAETSGSAVLRRLVILATPQPGGGVKVRVFGNDREGMMDRQHLWSEWSENLPKRSEMGQANPGDPAEREAADVLAEADGVDGKVQLLQDRVRIVRRGYFGGGNKEDSEVPIEEVGSVAFRSGFSGGSLQLVPIGQEAKRGWFRTSQYEVQFNSKQGPAFEAVRRAIEQRIGKASDSEESERGPAGTSEQATPRASEKAPTPRRTDTVAATPGGTAGREPETAVPTSRVAGGPEILSKKLRRLAEQNMADGESIRFCLLSQQVGGWSQAIIACDDRLLVIKPGFMAGATFGARATSFYYRDITGIEVNTGLMSGVIEINTPSYQGTVQKDFWNIKDENKDPYKVTNCLPIAKPDLKHYKPYVDRLRVMIRDAKRENLAVSPPTPRAHDASNLSSELEKLASLRDSGILTDEEFQQAKRRLLS